MNASRKQKLALNGGQPIFDRTSIPQWPKYHSDIIKSVDSVLKSRVWGVGSDHKARFEEEFARFQDSKYAVAVANGSIALYIALKACDIKLGDEVIVPSYTFQATAISVLLANAIPVFSDIDPSTYNICHESVESLIGDKTKAVIAVHLGGQPANMSKLKEICNRNGLILIEDAAQAHGAEWKGKKVGSIGDAGIFSFQSSKNMTAGEGGTIVTNSDAIYEKAVAIHDCGRNPKSRKYEPEISSLNFRMPAISAGILLPQFKTIKAEIEIRSSNGVLLDEILDSTNGIVPLAVDPSVTVHARHLYIMKYDKNQFSGISRDKLISALVAEGLPASAGYKPLHQQLSTTLEFDSYPWISKEKYFDVKLPESEAAANQEALWFPQNILLCAEELLKMIPEIFEKIKENATSLIN